VVVNVRSVRVPSIRGLEGSVYGQRIVYLDGGEGETIVFVHGSGVGGSGQMAWRPVAELMVKHRRVIAPDLLWSGWSGVPDLPYSLEAQADQLRELLDTLDIERCAVVGQSMGAYVAARFTCDQPDRVTHLCLVASNTVALSLGLDLYPTPGLSAKEAMDGSREGVRRLLETLYHRPEVVTESDLDEWTAINQRPGMERARESMTAYVDKLRTEPNRAQSFSLKGRLDKLTLPMALIWGRQDKFASMDLAPKMRELLPLTLYREIESAGHGVFRDQPDAFAAVLKEFLQLTQP
jgi:4,5:9,10-diseco-3-hydroxy-5,9,17-trioxoandrosta-1(10),2-diene-4-oate hydrolase